VSTSTVAIVYHQAASSLGDTLEVVWKSNGQKIAYWAEPLGFYFGEINGRFTTGLPFVPGR
jgi:hypothetical protein